MSFNPISMDDDGVAPFGGSRHHNGEDSYSAPEANRVSASIGGVSVVDPTMTAGEFIRRCKQQYYFEFSWQVPFPQVPAAPLLYLPEAFRELLGDPSPLGVMQAELDAMSAGVLERIPLGYYLLRPEVVEETHRVAMECEQRVEEMQRQAMAAGLPERLTWRPEEVNPYLDPADAELLDTDIDLNLVLERDKPSLTLLQRPLYTDMGLVPQEQRHLERLARIVPETLCSQTLLSSSQQSQLPADVASLPRGGIGTPPNSMEGLREGIFSNGHRAIDESQCWVEGVRKSFRFARTLDSHHDKMLESIARVKLGLDSSNPAAVRLTRRLWHLLLDGTKKDQQRDMWHQLCLFSNNYDAGRDVSEKLKEAVTDLQLPHHDLWLTLLHEYTNLLEEYTSQLQGGVKKRKEQLRFSMKELDPSKQVGAFEPDLQPGLTLRRLGRELGVNRQPVPIFPVKVMPLYPAGFHKAPATMAEGSQDKLGVLGEMGTMLRHVVLPGATLGEESRVGGPHALVNNTNLLVADKRSSRHLSNGITVSYRTSRENTFEPLVSDERNTSSYLFQICNMQEDPMPAGFANADGQHVVYRRLGVRDLFVKSPNAEAPPYERYVLMFGMEGDGMGESETGLGCKRPRISQNGEEESSSVLQRIN